MSINIWPSNCIRRRDTSAEKQSLVSCHCKIALWVIGTDSHELYKMPDWQYLSQWMSWTRQQLEVFFSEKISILFIYPKHGDLFGYVGMFHIQYLYNTWLCNIKACLRQIKRAYIHGGLNLQILPPLLYFGICPWRIEHGPTLHWINGGLRQCIKQLSRH